MAELAHLLRPTSAAVTNIGHQHMDGLGSLNDIALEKRDVFKYFTEDSIGIINVINQFLHMFLINIRLLSLVQKLLTRFKQEK